MRTKLALTTVLFLSVSLTATAQDQYKAKFINAFTRYMNWPEQTRSGFFNIGVYGSFDLYKLISEETMGRTVGKQNILAINIIKEGQLDLTDLHILVVGEKFCTPAILQKISAQLKGKHTLIVTEEGGVPFGAGIGFITKGSSLGFTYNTENIKKQGIMISKQFEAMGQEAN
ncbi:hypothetical protein C900_01407 [Fulvivirga imtechensis AK7]|uniref:DUF4154 domain-containing protein n=1 Tax=Fulvivirga imtechensis AK7 TaxID=1237149 RepID=L8K2W5_9BACT|nr:YfiR family protein [Fulvivirga imtechensis]ELR73797.1 hypothetical protein C900_01407 [Fulvivirga imtechensis AK7]